MNAQLSATAAGVIALVAGLLLAWNGDAPRTRITLLIGGSATVAAGVFGKVSDRIADSVDRVSTVTSAAVFGSAVGVLGMLLLTFILVRAYLKGGITHWTDAAAVILPPVAASTGGLILAACGLLATLVTSGIQGAWSASADLLASLRDGA